MQILPSLGRDFRADEDEVPGNIRSPLSAMRFGDAPSPTIPISLGGRWAEWQELTIIGVYTESIYRTKSVFPS
jgi:hypothetical protein